jgi:two-component system sensor histidine kinase UhpB
MSYVFVVLASVATIEAAMMIPLVIRRQRDMKVVSALRESEEHYRGIADNLPVLAWTFRTDTTIDYFNRTCLTFSGLPMERLMENGWFDAVHPDDLEAMINSYVPKIEARLPFLVEYRCRRADGVYRWLLAMGVPKYRSDGSYDGFIGCDIDITERKLAEDQIRESRAALDVSYREIQHLAGRLIEAQDAERARIARDLHDDVSQQLAGLSIALSSIKRRMDDLNVSDSLKEDLRSIHQRSSTLAQNVRHLSHDLHPTVLRHAGLLASLNSYCAEVSRTHGIDIQCRADGDIESISPEGALCLYRIGQEALRNVIAHAGATRADVRLLRNGDIAEIIVEDNGRGFDVTRSLEHGTGLGLVSITERARFAGGTVTVVSEPGNRTRVWAQVPAHTATIDGNGAGTKGGAS